MKPRARRPDIFNRQGFEASLRNQGCAESFVSPTVSDAQLFIPLVLRALGPERIFELVEHSRSELGLRPQEAAWRTAANYIVGWAEAQIDEYKALKHVGQVE